MKRTPSTTLALTNLLLLAVLPVLTWVLFTRIDIVTIWDVRRLQRLELGLVLLVFLLLFIVPLASLTLAVVDVWRGFRRQALLSAAISLVLVVVLFLWLGFGDRLASYQEARADRAWTATLESVDRFLARYPDEPDSESVVKLTAAAARIGVDLDPFDAQGAQPSVADQKAFQAVERRVSAFVSSQTRKADDALDAPAPDVFAWLSAHDASIAALVGEVRSDGPIVFATDWSSARRPEPGTVGVKAVVTVMILRALQCERLGDSQAANEALEASWKLGGTVRDRGETLNQILAAAIDSMTLGALRQLRKPGHAWVARVAAHDYVTSMLRSLEGESRTLSGGLNGWTATDQMRRRRSGGLFRLERPYLRLMAADSSLAWAGMVAELKTTDPCRTDSAVLYKRAERLLAVWNFAGSIGVPSAVRGWSMAARTALEAEMTRNILAARELRDERGAWPSEPPGLESSVCPGERWDYSTSPDGRMSLSIRWNPSLGPPLVFRAGPR